MNFRDPNLILIKKLRGGSHVYFQVCANNSEKVTLQDIMHGGKFTFDKADIEGHIKKQVLTICKRNEIPDAAFKKPVLKKEKVAPTETQLQNKEEVEKRYQYIRRLLDSDIDSLGEKKLKPWIEKTSKELNDPAPPSYKTLGRWLKMFQESGWKKNSLLPNHKSKGNYASRIPTEVESIICHVIRDYLREGKRGKITRAYQDFVNRVESLNSDRVLEGLDEYPAVSYRSFRKRFIK